MLYLLERELGGVHLTWLVDGALRGLVASLVSALLAWSSWKVLDDALGQSFLAQLVSMTAALAAATLAYGAAAHAFEMPELRQLSRLGRPLR